MKNILISFLVLLFVALNLIAASNRNEENSSNYRTESFSFERGIAHQTVYDIYKDKKGFLWFGTMYGLVHYMGSNIKIYRHDPNDKNTLSNDDVTKIFEDSKGNFWIATFGGGFNKLDIKNNKVTRYTPSSMNLFDEWNGITWDIVEDDKGKIVVATDNIGLIIMDPATDEFSVYSESENGEKLAQEKKLFKDGDGNIYINFVGRDFFKFDEKNEQIIPYKFPNLNVDDIESIVAGINNDLFIAADARIYHYYTDTNKYEDITKKYPESKTSSAINTLTLDSQNNLWIGSFSRVCKIDFSNNTVTKFTAKDRPDKRIQPGPVVEIVEDNTGIIWTGSYLGGITKIINKPKLFTAIKFDLKEDANHLLDKATNILPLSNSDFLIGSTNGLSYYNLLTESFQNLLSEMTVYSIEQGDSNNIWLGTNKGILLLDNKFNVINTIKSEQSNPNSLSSNTVISLKFDKQGSLWAGTANGLNKIDLTDNYVTQYVDDLDNDNDFSGRLVLSVYVDKQGYVWAGTYNGLNRFDPATNTFKLYKHDFDDPTTISNNYVFSYCEDSDGNFWIGTGNGLNKFNYETESFEFISQSDGLRNAVIFGIVEVNKNLFLSTADGISTYNTKNGLIKNYTSIQGLNSNMFHPRSYAQCPNGNAVFGGLNGFTILNSSDYFNQHNDAPIYITSISSIEGKIAENSAYSKIDKIKFPYSASYIQFNFSSLDFSLPEGTDYQFMLKGFDSTWVDSKNKPFAVYTKIPSGNYKFLVKSGNSKSSLASIEVIVTPPFWQTYWFYLSLIALFVLTAYLFYKNKLRLELKRASQVEHIRNEEERKLRKKTSEDFHDELGHRITKISLYSELLRRTISDQESGSLNYLMKISEISTNLATGVKDFIWTLDPGKDTLYDVAIRLKDFGDDLFDKSGIAFRTSGIKQEYENIDMLMDWRRHTILIFKEAMNNILKYSNAKNVLLTFTLENNEIDISLTDDGDGFDIDKIKMGRGLKNIRMRAASVQGKIDIQSSEGEGTSIRLHSSLR